MKPDDEPRIKRTRKPQIEERLPPHLDEEHYEIVGQPTSDSVYSIPEKKRNKKRKPKKYFAPRVYFYICVVLLVVVAVEAVMLGVAQSNIDSQKETIDSQKETIDSQKETIDRLSNDIGNPKAKIEDQENNVDKKEDHNAIEKIQNYAEFLCRCFVFDPNYNDAEGTMNIRITYPDRPIFDFLSIDPEKVTMSIELVEIKDKWNNLLEENARVIGVVPGQTMSEQYTTKQKLGPGDYEVVVTISCEGENPVRIIIYRLKILESQSV